jgi:hypothetical protein
MAKAVAGNQILCPYYPMTVSEVKYLKLIEFKQPTQSVWISSNSSLGLDKTRFYYVHMLM